MTLYHHDDAKWKAILWTDEKTGSLMCLLINDESGTASIYPAGSISGLAVIQQIENAQVHVFRNKQGVATVRIFDGNSKLAFFGPVTEPELYHHNEVGILDRETEA